MIIMICELNVSQGVVHAASYVCGLFIIVPYTAKVCLQNHVLQLKLIQILACLRDSQADFQSVTGAHC